MSYTKRQFVQAAFEEIGLGSYIFDLQPEQLQSAMRRMDAMIGEWNARGVRLPYPLPLNPSDSDLDTDTEVPDSATEAIVCGLAVRLAPSFGRQVMPGTMATAHHAYGALLAIAAAPQEMQYPGNLPIGAGHKNICYDRNFYGNPVDPVKTGPEGILELD